MIKRFFYAISQAVAPKRCYKCWKWWSYFCTDCQKSLQIYTPFCYECKKYSPNFEIHEKCRKKDIFYDQIIVLTHYKQSFVKKLLHDGKFYHRYQVYDEILSLLSQEFLKVYPNYTQENYIFSFAPMHFLRKWKRGYNQSEVISQKLAKNLWVSIKAVLRKAKSTRQQSHLSMSQRRQNLSASIHTSKKYLSLLRGQNIVVCDDVISTGSTLNECAKTLKQNGAKKVIGLIIASD